MDRRSHRRRLLPAVVLGLLVCIGFMAMSSAPASAFRKTLPLNPAELDAASLGRALTLARRAGVKQIQASATWWWIMRRGPGTYDWSAIDRLVEAADARGMKVVLQLQGTPDWVHPDLTASVHDHDERIWHPPVRNEVELRLWASFVWDVVNRYRGRVEQYELWNEPNLPHFWNPQPSVEEFAHLMKAGYYAARQVDPGAKVVLGGLSFNDLGFLRAYYDTIDAQWRDEARGQSYFFDVLGVHPYSENRSPRVEDDAHMVPGWYGDVDKNFLGFRRLRQIVQARDVVAKPVYIGEYGFSTIDTWMPAVSDRVRARHLRQAYNLAAAEKYVTGMAWYGYIPNSATGFEWAIVNTSLKPSRTFKALRQAPSRKNPKATAGAGSG